MQAGIRPEQSSRVGRRHVLIVGRLDHTHGSRDPVECGVRVCQPCGFDVAPRLSRIRGRPAAAARAAYMFFFGCAWIAGTCAHPPVQAASAKAPKRPPNTPRITVRRPGFVACPLPRSRCESFIVWGSRHGRSKKPAMARRRARARDSRSLLSRSPAPMGSIGVRVRGVRDMLRADLGSASCAS